MKTQGYSVTIHEPIFEDNPIRFPNFGMAVIYASQMVHQGKKATIAPCEIVEKSNG